MNDLNYLQELASRFGKCYDYVMFQEDNIAYVFKMDEVPCVPATIHEDCIEKTVGDLMKFGKSVRIVNCVDNTGKYVLPDVEELDRAREEDY